MEAERFDDEVVVFALREPGDRDATQNARSSYVEGKATTVSCIVGIGKTVPFGKGDLVLLEIEANPIRAAVEAGNNVRFALNPSSVVGSRASERSVEQGLMRQTEATDIDNDSVVARNGHVAEAQAKAPRSIVVEAVEPELGLLLGDSCKVFGDCHRRVLWS